MKNTEKPIKLLLLQAIITYISMVLFSEDHIQETRRRGRIEVICGSMFPENGRVDSPHEAG